ncbi:PR domain zinc finger protein 5 [Eumeta japonica]|uniref:PR domain zinc finger protein 5 n=1 Tax=Eumeta variegata TaxID=151549 RepID=A0A4C1T8D7_EUMVA|nr:PR domain zinc finger protein 5 [Eumeta japonica]
MKDILDILNPSSFTWNQLDTLDGDSCIFEAFNDQHPYEADTSENVSWVNDRSDQTQNFPYNSIANNAGQVQNNLDSQIAGVCGYENPAIDEADLKLYVEGGNIQQFLEMDVDFSSSYESEVLNQLPDALVETPADVISDYGDVLTEDATADLQCSEIWDDRVAATAYLSSADHESDAARVKNSNLELSIPFYTDNKQIYYYDSAVEQYTESEIQAGLAQCSESLNSTQESLEQMGMPSEETENLMRDIEDNIHNIDTTITLHLLENDEFEKGIANAQSEQPLLSEILKHLPDSVESSQMCEETRETGSSRYELPKYENIKSELSRKRIRDVSEKLEESSEADCDYYSDVEVDDPNDQDYCPTEIDMMMEMGFGPDIYSKIPERQKGYNLRPRGKRSHIKVKDISELRDTNENLTLVEKESKKYVAKRRKLVCELRNTIYQNDKTNDEDGRVSEEDDILASKSVTAQIEINNDALKQLLSPGIRKTMKQHKTITFQGEDPKYGRTVQKIKVVDPTIKCITENCDKSSQNEVDSEKVPDSPMKKKYQCGKCDKVFEELSSFKEHNKCTVENLKNSSKRGKKHLGDYDDFRFLCTQCGKTLKNQDKFEMHCRGHGDPEVECEICHKVFATKATLRNHKRLHERPYSCETCYKSFEDVEKLRKHEMKNYCTYKYDMCDNESSNNEEIEESMKQNSNLIIDSGLKNCNESTIENNDIAKVNGVSSNFPANHIGAIEDLTRIDIENNNSLLSKAITLVDTAEISSTSNEEKNILTSNFHVTIQRNSTSNHLEAIKDNVKEADAMMAKVLETDIFLKERSGKKSKYHNKVCNVCGKTFDRVGDLKRHLIEHVIRANLLKNPVGRDGILHLQCEICQVATFTKIDKYKAHLREHAKLTLYQCKFCDKSFSDSSNFSKHKKVHGAPSFQCDLCQRKFNSKKMIAQHMEYHSNTEPILCQYCEKVFHFESSLKKHLKLVHNRNKTAQFRCKLCHQYFRSLKEKWDHESGPCIASGKWLPTAYSVIRSSESILS